MRKIAAMCMSWAICSHLVAKNAVQLNKMFKNVDREGKIDADYGEAAGTSRFFTN